MADKEVVGMDQECVGPVLCKTCKGRLNIDFGAGIENLYLPVNGLSRGSGQIAQLLARARATFRSALVPARCSSS